MLGNIRRLIGQVEDDALRQNLSELLTETATLIQQNNDLQQLVSDLKIFVEDLCRWPDTDTSNDIANELQI